MPASPAAPVLKTKGISPKVQLPVGAQIIAAILTLITSGDTGIAAGLITAAIGTLSLGYYADPGKVVSR